MPFVHRFPGVSRSSYNTVVKMLKSYKGYLTESHEGQVWEEGHEIPAANKLVTEGCPSLQVPRIKSFLSPNCVWVQFEFLGRILVLNIIYSNTIGIQVLKTYDSTFS